jgi:hypothetical protein
MLLRDCEGENSVTNRFLPGKCDDSNTISAYTHVFTETDTSPAAIVDRNIVTFCLIHFTVGLLPFADISVVLGGR